MNVPKFIEYLKGRKDRKIEATIPSTEVAAFIEILEFMRDHKHSAREDQEFRAWIEQECKNLRGIMDRGPSPWSQYNDAPIKLRVLDSILRYLDEPEPQPTTPPKLTGDYFGAEF